MKAGMMSETRLTGAFVTRQYYSLILILKKLISLSLIFRWVFIPFLQRELDNYRRRINFTAKRADRNKILPHGVPADIHSNPHEYGCLDFKVHRLNACFYCS
jgi:hypothetical protein